MNAIGIDLPSMVAILDGLPPMVKSLDLTNKFEAVMTRIHAIQDKFEQAVAADAAPELTDEDATFLGLELEFGDVFRRVVVSCVRARQYRRMPYMEELLPMIVAVNRGGSELGAEADANRGRKVERRAREH